MRTEEATAVTAVTVDAVPHAALRCGASWAEPMDGYRRAAVKVAVQSEEAMSFMTTVV
jgi:hypothetical protein